MENNIMKTIMIAGALMLASTFGASAESWIDRYNASLNTPEAKRESLARTCARSGDPAAFWQCEYQKRNGVPDSDVRIGIIGAGVLLGAGAGMAATSVPIGALGGKTLFAQWGVTHILGTAATVAVSGAAGAAVGGVVAGAYAVTR
jgi:hypothetical protein